MMDRLRRHPFVVEVLARLLCLIGIPVLAAGRRRDTLAIIMFHGVEAEPLSPPCSHVHDLRTLRRQLEFVQRHFCVLPLEEALEALRAGTLPARAVALTFDDGTRNLATNAGPVLRRLGLPAAVFLATGPMGTAETLWPDRLWTAFASTTSRSVDLSDIGMGVCPLRVRDGRAAVYEATVGRLKELSDAQRLERVEFIVECLGFDHTDEGPFRLLSWDEARALAEDGGVTLYPHSVTHPILARCPDDKVHAEVEGSCDAIERETGCTPNVFAYPNGRTEDFDERTKDALRRRGVNWALSTTRGFADSESDPLALPRIPANKSFALFRLQVSGALA